MVNAQVNRTRRLLAYYRRYWMLYVMLVLPIAFFIIFKYIPFAYVQIAFKKYSFGNSLSVMPFEGFKYFAEAFRFRDFILAVRNTLMLNLLDLVVGFPAPVLLALLLNEVSFKRFKRVTQTVLYMPHFLSWIIISGIAKRLFASDMGLINLLIKNAGRDPVPFMDNSTYWVFTYVFLGVWKNMGWNTIIYLAALTAINPELYEAAYVDGAGRFRRIWHITLPGIRPTIITLLILNLGRILGSEFDRPYALSNFLVKDVSNVISTFVYTYGLRSSRFSLSTAVGLFQSVICVVFLLSSNAIAKQFGERGVW